MRTTTVTAIALIFLSLLGFGYAAKKAAQKNKDKQLPNKVGKKDKDKYESSSLKEIGGKTLDLWLKDLKSSDPGVYENAIRTIPFFGSRAKLAVPIVLAKVKSTRAYALDTSVKVNSAIFLGIIGLEDEKDLHDAVKGLHHFLDDSQAIVRFHSALALGRIGSGVNETGAEGKLALKKLVSRLGDTSTWEIRKACAGALARVAMPPNKNTTPDPVVIYQLRRRLTSVENCAQVRMEAAQTLVMLGPPRKPDDRSDLIQTLRRAADNKKEDTVVRIWANVGIMRMAGMDKKRVAFIGDLLDHDILGIRCQASRALSIMGSDAKTQVNKLRAALKDKDTLMLNWVLIALANMGSSARGALPSLEELGKKADKNKDKVLAKAVAETIKMIKKGKAKDDDEKPNKLKIEKKPKKRPPVGRFDE
jgi:HEAT repeat protein